MSTWLEGPAKWEMSRDKDGYVDLTIVHKVFTDSATTGPNEILETPGLPLPGSVWRFGDDENIEAYCKQDARVTMIVEDVPNYHWRVEQKFSNRGDDKRCKDQQIENPLMEPQKISGGFSKVTVEATTDRFGVPITNSAWEQVRGAQVEFDESRPSIKIEQNVPLLELSLLVTAKDCVNAFSMWGLPPRTVKLSGVSWSRKFYGQCNVYYTRDFEFEINFDTWDRDLLDEGTKVLHGEWSKVNANWNVTQLPGAITPDRFNPQHFIRFKDRRNENTKVVLDGFGLPWIPPEAILQKWWCINDGVAAYKFFGTCAAMKIAALAPTFTITNVTGLITAAPLTITTSAPHGFANGDLVTIEGVQGCIAANGNDWAVTVINATAFTIVSASSGAYTSGGTVTKQNNILIHGPENTEAALADVCDNKNRNGFLPSDFICDTMNQPGNIHVEKYREMDFFVLGIPANF